MKPESYLGLLPMSRGAEHEFIYNPQDKDGKSLLPKKLRPTFYLEPMTVKARKDFSLIQSKMQRDLALMYSNPEREEIIKNSVDENEKLLRAVSKFVTGWENLKDAKGNEFEFRKDEHGKLLPDCFLELPVLMQASIIDEVSRISGLTTSEQLGLKS